MKMTKDWYKSKLIWLGIVAAIYNLLSVVGIELPIDQENVNGYVNTTFGLLAIIFRWRADEVITQSAKGAEIQSFTGLNNRR